MKGKVSSFHQMWFFALASVNQYWFLEFSYIGMKMTREEWKKRHIRASVLKPFEAFSHLCSSEELYIPLTEVLPGYTRCFPSKLPTEKVDRTVTFQAEDSSWMRQQSETKIFRSCLATNGSYHNLVQQDVEAFEQGHLFLWVTGKPASEDGVGFRNRAKLRLAGEAHNKWPFPPGSKVWLYIERVYGCDQGELWSKLEELWESFEKHAKKQSWVPVSLLSLTQTGGLPFNHFNIPSSHYGYQDTLRDYPRKRIGMDGWTLQELNFDTFCTMATHPNQPPTPFQILKNNDSIKITAKDLDFIESTTALSIAVSQKEANLIELIARRMSSEEIDAVSPFFSNNALYICVKKNMLEEAKRLVEFGASMTKLPLVERCALGNYIHKILRKEMIGFKG